MFAIVGLGNPGARYEGTRHNVGFDVVRLLAQRWGAESGWQGKFGCQFTRARFGSRDGLLVLPQKFMNLSGQAAVPLLHYFKVPPAELTVAHDELDLDVGQLRVRQGGSSAGHRGITDIVQHLGTSDFYRVRIGIGHPRRTEQRGGGISEKMMGVSDWVLGHPGPEEKELLENSVQTAARAIETLLEQGLQEVQRQYHRKPTG